jgi:hypothetical protein
MYLGLDNNGDNLMADNNESFPSYLGRELWDTAKMIPQGWGLLGEAAVDGIRSGGSLLEGLWEQGQQNRQDVMRKNLEVQRAPAVDNSPAAREARGLAMQNPDQGPMVPTSDIPDNDRPLVAPPTPPAPVETAVSKVTDDSTVGEVKQAVAQDQQAKKAAQNQAIAQTTRAELQRQGRTEEELGVWDKFTSEYDLGTIGMALLASNDGRSNIWANLGNALMAGKQSVLGAEATAYARGKDEREFGLKQHETASKRITANAAATKAAAALIPDGWELGTVNATHRAAVDGALAELDIDIDAFPGGSEAAEGHKEVIAQKVASALKTKPELSNQTGRVARDATEHYMTQFRENPSILRHIGLAPDYVRAE